MKKFSLLLKAQFQLPGDDLPLIEDQYRDLWRLAKLLEEMGLPLDTWYHIADTPANSVLNLSFDENGVTTAALAMARAEKQQYPEQRDIAVWNGAQEDERGKPIGVAAAFNTLLGPGSPSLFSMDMREVQSLRDYRAVLKIVLKIIEIWRPYHVSVAPFAYAAKKVFEARPGVGWMVYLPLTLTTEQVPEAAELIPVYDEADGGKKRTQRGTVVVSVAETFDAKNPEHIQRANAIEIRLADQDLLPTYMELSNKP